jgi:hypothetical protein
LSLSGTFVIGTASFFSHLMDIRRRFRNHTVTALLVLLTLTSGLLLANRAIPKATAATPATTFSNFSNFELAGNPFTAGSSVGVTCPNQERTCQNTEGEPSIRVDRAGNFYGSSENVFCVIGGQCGGTFAYRSIDGGQSFTTLPLPNSVSSGKLPPTCTDFCRSVGFSPAGGDTDIAVAPRRNSRDNFNIYVASLATTPPLANVYVSTSKDGGNTWFPNPTGAQIPVDDREWIAADGANKVCVSYHAIGTTNDIFVTCSIDGGMTFPFTANAFEPTKVAFLANFNNAIGNLAIDPRNHVIYQVFSAVKDLPDSLACGISCHTHTVWIARSIDGGATFTFTDHIVYNNPDTSVDYGHQFVNVSVDNTGNVYVIYSDDHNLFYSFSTTFGNTWFGPFQINKSPSNTAIFPWSTAGSNGALDVVWYGTDFIPSVSFPHPDTYPNTALWSVYFSQDLLATTPGSSWNQVAASGIIHHGGVCEAGVTCTGNRDLLDDFGVAASPTTGLAAIIYTSDQFVDSTQEPATRRSATSPFCTLNTNNNIDCEHTNIAVQTSGPGINQNPHNFEVDEEDFENTDLNGGNAPDFKMHGDNKGDTAIASISVQVSGLPVTFTWTNAFPLLPGQAATAETRTLPLGLVLTVGNIYTVTITAKLADGTTETQSTNAIYTLGAGLGL